MPREPPRPRGQLIVVEGLDRTGKTTQCELLKESLEKQGRTVFYQKFPDRTTESGVLINNYLAEVSCYSDHAIHLIFSANRWEAVKTIEKHLAKGETVIIDRYSFSGAVYSAAKELPRLDLDWTWSCEVGLPKPDLLIFLHITKEKASKRPGYGKERYEHLWIQAKVAELYPVLFERLAPQNITIEQIDAGISIDALHEKVMEVVNKIEEPKDHYIDLFEPLPKIEKPEPKRKRAKKED